jgi:predicted SAM-dependent methyltransferase
MKKLLPWWLKIISKIILSRLSIPYSFWQYIGLFRHGKMDDPEYSIDVFKNHFAKSGIDNLKDKVVVEIGPGDSIATAMISYAFGASSILIDTQQFANFNIKIYLKLKNKLHQLGYPVPDLDESDNLKSVLKKTNSIYLTQGLKSINKIENESVDLIFSQAVLEHIKLYEFDEIIRELSRIQKKNGISSHQVDLRDHLSESLNNLRFSEKLWESNLFSNSGFYTNRIGFDKMLEIFKSSYSNVQVLNVNKWHKLPISKKKFDKNFQTENEDSLLVRVFDVTLRKM